MTKRAFISAQRTKPLGAEGIEAIRKVLKEGQATKVNEVLVDSFSAGAIVAVHDALKPEHQAKLRGLCVAQAASVSFKLINRQGASA